MMLSEKRVQEELTALIERYAGGAQRVARAYYERRNRQRDIHWLALQATKEFGAMVYHSGAMARKAKALASMQDIRKSNQDALEEAEHYCGYMEILNWYLGGQPCDVPEMWGYGDISAGFGPGAAMKESLWPEHYRYFEMGQRLTKEAPSDWQCEVILSNREGAAVGFHYVMSRLPATDEYLKRLTDHERSVAEDEMHHGSEVIPELARTATSEEELEQAKQKVTDVHVQELRQRNEQFLHPLSEAEMNILEADFRAGRIEPVPLFPAVAAD
jgi:hypothetical protein